MNGRVYYSRYCPRCGRACNWFVMEGEEIEKEAPLCGVCWCDDMDFLIKQKFHEAKQTRERLTP